MHITIHHPVSSSNLHLNAVRKEGGRGRLLGYYPPRNMNNSTIDHLFYVLYV
jgi:hypothetical protein